MAQNTSGLWGGYLDEVIDRYVETGELIRRPYQRGVYPTHPQGVVMEKGFFPTQLRLTLSLYGLRARQSVTWLDRLKFLYVWLRYFYKRMMGLKTPDQGNVGLYMIARKSKDPLWR